MNLKHICFLQVHVMRTKQTQKKDVRFFFPHYPRNDNKAKSRLSSHEMMVMEGKTGES